jgi:hypothetical protein
MPFMDRASASASGAVRALASGSKIGSGTPNEKGPRERAFLS